MKRISTRCYGRNHRTSLWVSPYMIPFKIRDKRNSEEVKHDRLTGTNEKGFYQGVRRPSIKKKKQENKVIVGARSRCRFFLNVKLTKKKRKISDWSHLMRLELGWMVITGGIADAAHTISLSFFKDAAFCSAANEASFILDWPFALLWQGNWNWL